MDDETRGILTEYIDAAQEHLDAAWGQWSLTPGGAESAMAHDLMESQRQILHALRLLAGALAKGGAA